MGGGPRTAKARSPGPPCCAPAVRAASRWRCAPGGRRRGALAAGKNPGSQREVEMVWKEVRSKPPEGFHPERESQGRGSREEDGVFLPSRREAGGVGEASLWRDGLERTGCFWAGEGVWGVGGDGGGAVPLRTHLTLQPHSFHSAKLPVCSPPGWDQKPDIWCHCFSRSE